MQILEIVGWGWLFGPAGFLALWMQQGAPNVGQTHAMLLPVPVWSARRGVQPGLRRVAEDPRHAESRKRFSPHWPAKSLVIVFVLQGVPQLAVASGVLAALSIADDNAPTAASLALAALAPGAGVVRAPLSTLLVIGLIRYVSGVAILEDRLSRTRRDFEAYRNRAPALVPVLRPAAGPKRVD